MELDLHSAQDRIAADDDDDQQPITASSSNLAANQIRGSKVDRGHNNVDSSDHTASVRNSSTSTSSTEHGRISHASTSRQSQASTQAEEPEEPTTAPDAEHPDQQQAEEAEQHEQPEHRVSFQRQPSHRRAGMARSKSHASGIDQRDLGARRSKRRPLPPPSPAAAAAAFETLLDQRVQCESPAEDAVLDDPLPQEALDTQPTAADLQQVEAIEQPVEQAEEQQQDGEETVDQLLVKSHHQGEDDGDETLPSVLPDLAMAKSLFKLRREADLDRNAFSLPSLRHTLLYTDEHDGSDGSSGSANGMDGDYADHDVVFMRSPQSERKATATLATGDTSGVDIPSKAGQVVSWADDLGPFFAGGDGQVDPFADQSTDHAAAYSARRKPSESDKQQSEPHQRSHSQSKTSSFAQIRTKSRVQSQTLATAAQKLSSPSQQRLLSKASSFGKSGSIHGSMAAKSVSCDLGQPSSGAAAKPAVPSTASEAATADATAPADSTPGSKTKSTASLQREPSQRKTSQSAFLHRSKASVAHEVAGAAAAIERSRSAIHNPHPHHGACLDVGIETLDGSVLVHTPPPCMRNIWRHHDDGCDQDCGVAKDDCQQTHGADLQQASPRSPKHASRQRHQQHGTVSQFEAVEVFPRRQHLTGSTATPPPPPPPPPQAHPVQAKPSEPLSAAPLKQQTDAHQDGSCAARASQSLQNPPSKSKPDEPRPVAEDAARMPARGRSAEPASTADPSTVEYSHDAVERRAVKLRISSAFHRLPSARAASTRTPWSANDMHNESRSIKPNKPALPASGSGMAIINLGRIFGVNNLNPRVCQILNASRRDRSKTESREDWTKDGQTALPPPSVEYEHLGGSLDQDTLAMARQKTHQQHQQQQQEQSDELSGSVPDPSREILPPQSLLGRPIDNHHYTSSNSSDSDGRANTKAQPTIHQAERKSVQFVAGTFVSKDIHQRTHSASAQHSSPKPMALGSINTNNGRLQTSIITNSNSISLDPRHGAHSAAGLAYGNVEIDAVLSASPGSGGVQSGGASGVTSGSAPASTSRSAKTANPASASRDVSHIGMPDISAGAYDPLGDYPPSEPQTSVHFQQLRLHVEEPQPKPSTATVIFERLAERSRDHGVLERPLDMGLLNALNQAAKSAVGAGAWPNKLFGDTSNVAVSLLQVPVEARLQRVPSHISKLKSSPALATGTSNPSQYGAAVAAAVGISSQPSSAAGPAGSAQQSAIAGTDGAGTTLASSKAGVSLAVIEPRLRKGMWVIIRPLKKSKRRKGHSSGYAGSTAGRTETGASHNAAAQTAATSTPIPASLLASIVPVGCSGPGGGAFHPPLLPMHHHLTAVGPRTGSSARVRQDVKTMLARVQSKQQSAPQQQQTDLGALIRRSSARNSSIGKPSVAQGPSDRLVGSASANPGAGGRESLSKRSGSGSLLRLSLTQPAVSDGQKDTKAVTIDAPSSSARRASSRPWTHNAGLSRRAASLPSMGIDRNTDDDMLSQRPVHASHHYSTLRLRAVAPFAFDGPVAAATTGMGDRTFSRIARGDAEYHDEYVRDPKLISVTPGPWA